MKLGLALIAAAAGSDASDSEAWATDGILEAAPLVLDSGSNALPDAGLDPVNVEPLDMFLTCMKVLAMLTSIWAPFDPKMSPEQKSSPSY